MGLDGEPEELFKNNCKRQLKEILYELEHLKHKCHEILKLKLKFITVENV
jgi:hypothetical protein